MEHLPHLFQVTDWPLSLWIPGSKTVQVNSQALNFEIRSSPPHFKNHPCINSLAHLSQGMLQLALNQLHLLIPGSHKFMSRLMMPQFQVVERGTKSWEA